MNEALETVRLEQDQISANAAPADSVSRRQRDHAIVELALEELDQVGGGQSIYVLE